MASPKITNDVPLPTAFQPNDGTILKWDEYVPPGTGPWPACIVVHGGGFSSLDSHSTPLMKTAATDISNTGVICFALNYRQAPPGLYNNQPSHSNPASGRPPEQTDDIQLAVKAIRQDPRCNGLVGGIGGSGGGFHISYAMMDSTTHLITSSKSTSPQTWTGSSDRLNVGVSLSGAYDLHDRTDDGYGALAQFVTLIENYTNTTDLSIQLADSVVPKVTPDAHPLAMFATPHDPMPRPQMTIMANTLSGQSPPVTNFTQTVVPGTINAHAWAYWNTVITGTEQVRDRSVAFLGAVLLAPVTGPNPPVISSATSAGGYVGTAFSYTITASNSPTLFGATGLPSWATINTSTGVISGTPDTTGTYTIALTASNAGGQGKANLSLRVVASIAPVITSASTAPATVGTSFSYTITATNSPTSFNATGTLPPGLTRSGAVISGTPTTAGTYTPQIYATNANGSDNITLTITVTGPSGVPVITSSANVTGNRSTNFSYQIVGTNSPTSYGATSLPLMLSVDPATGLITGPLTVGVGTYTFTVSATNATGKGTLLVTINVVSTTLPPIPTGLSWLNSQNQPIPSFPLTSGNVDIITLGASWSLLNPSQGVFDFTSYLEPQIKAAADAGKYILIRCGTMGGFASKGGTTPDWVATAMGASPTSNTIVPGKTYTWDTSSGIATFPVFWEPNFLAAKIAFYQALGNYVTNATTLTATQKGKIRIVAASFVNANTEDWSIPNGTAVVSTGGPTGTGYPLSELNRWLNATNATPPGAGYTSAKLLTAGQQIIDAAMAAFPNQYITLAISGSGSSLDATASGGTDTTNYMSRAIYAYEKSANPGRLICQRQSVSAKQEKAPSTPGGAWRPLYDFNQAGDPVAGQALWFCYQDTTFRMNAGSRNDLDYTGAPPIPQLTDQQILDRSGERGAGYGMRYLEVYKADFLNLSTDYIRTLYYQGTAQAVPVITSPQSVTGTTGALFSYQIVATSNPTSYATTGLPAGLTVNTATGLITGYPGVSGITSATMTATNGVGSDIEPLAITISKGEKPAITSPLIARAIDLVPFSFAVTATNNPVFTTQGLPSWLSLNSPSSFLAPPGDYGVVGEEEYLGTTGAPSDVTIATLSGTPPENQKVIDSFTIRATNDAGQTSVTMLLSVSYDGNSPIFTSQDNASVTTLNPVNIHLTATNGPTSFSSSFALPDGLTLDTTTGILSGTPTTTQTWAHYIYATNASGSDIQLFTIFISEGTIPAPVVTSTGNIAATNGSNFSYQITATNNPTSYAVDSLPVGLSLNSTTGRISGIPTIDGVYSINQSATNGTGTGSASFTLTVSALVLAPVVNSPPSASGVAGTALTYQITATNNPTSYAATGLPNGLSVNTSTGLISGTPTSGGVSTVNLKATNYAGSGTAVLVLTITGTGAAPVITSPDSIIGTTGQSLNYQITATNSPTSYSATGLQPTGLTLDTVTGAISGVLGAVGTYTVTLRAINSLGHGDLVLTIGSVADGASVSPVIISSGAASGSVGIGFQYQINATNSPTRYGVDTLPNGLTLNPASGLIMGNPTTSGSFISTVTATNNFGTGSLELSILISAQIVIPPVPIKVKLYAYPEQAVFSEDTFAVIVLDQPPAPGPDGNPPPATVIPTAPSNLVVTPAGQLGSGLATATWAPPSNSN